MYAAAAGTVSSSFALSPPTVTHCKQAGQSIVEGRRYGEWFQVIVSAVLMIKSDYPFIVNQKQCSATCTALTRHEGAQLQQGFNATA